MRALAVTSAKRNPAMPELPTVAEAGPEGPLRGYAFDTWFVVAAPKGTPRAIVDTLNSHIRKALTSPDQVKFYEERGLTVIASTPEEAAAHLENEQEEVGSRHQGARHQGGVTCCRVLRADVEGLSITM
jgi:tripartite-type tricarboxylate transporter receptor subunit TctC